MSDVSAVLSYLADVASADAKTKTHVGKVTFTGVDPIDENVSGRKSLRPLLAADLLHAEEHLVHQGRLWLVGSIDGVEYQWPIVRRRVSLGGRFSSRAMPPLVKPRGPWHLPRGLVPQPELESLALRDAIWDSFNERVLHFDPIGDERSEQVRPLGHFEMERVRLERFVKQYLEAAGLPHLPISAGSDLPPGSAPTVLVSNGYYLERHPFELDRASALKLWTGHDVSQTVLVALYGNAPYAQQDDLDHDRSIHAPLPLNASQRTAITASRSSHLTVVSGPPGTGKSHLVAAAAIDQIAAGRSVLIASQSVHACDVVADLLDRYPMVEALRFGDDGSVRRLSDKLAAGIPAPDRGYDHDLLSDLCKELTKQIAQGRKRLEQRIGDVASFEGALIRRHDIPLWLAQQDLDAIDVEAANHAITQLEAAGWLAWWKRRSAQRVLAGQLGPKAMSQIPALPEILKSVEAEQLVNAIAGRDLGLDELWTELDRLENRWRRKMGDLLEAQRRQRAGSGNRKALQQFASALRLGPLRRRQALADVGSQFLQVAPLWIGTLGEIEAVLPVQAGLFDMVILDESSQISQISAVPALARAKRAIIVGDSRQLRHVSFVSGAVQSEAAAAHELSPALASRLNDRTNSVFDAATAVAPVVELDEHFRSVPHIIGFSDRLFYERRLRLMTQHPLNESRDAIEVVTVVGERDSQRVVQAELDEVLRRVRSLMTAGTTSIGIVSPFRAQADAIEEAVIARFRLDEIERHHLRVGTVHSFQGTERDHMIISIGLGPDDRRALRFVEDPAVFNVMVTRARSHITVVTTLSRATAGSGLLGQYLRHSEEPPSPRRAQVHASGWTERVARELDENTSQRVITDYEVAGETIDVVIGSGSNALGIETEVHPDGPARHIERRLALRRAGWDITSLHRSSCYGSEEAAIVGLLTRFNTDS